MGNVNKIIGWTNLIVILVLVTGYILLNNLLSDGSMPTENEALSIKKEALEYGLYCLTLAERDNNNNNNKEHKSIQDAVQIAIDNNMKFMAYSGYYYSFKNVASGPFVTDHISDGVYNYYNPG